MGSFSDWAKIRQAEIVAEKEAKKNNPTGNPREQGYRLAFDMCKRHGIDLSVATKAVRDGDIEGFVSGSHTWVNRDDFRDYFKLG